MNDKITFTLAEIRKHSPCQDGWKKLNKTLGSNYEDDTPITISQIIESNGLDDALWCLRTTPDEIHYLWRHFAADCAASVYKKIDDERVLKCIYASHLYADGEITKEELSAARSAAWSAAWSAARLAARLAAESAAMSAAESSAMLAAESAAMSAAESSAMSAARSAQSKLLIEYCKTGERVKNPERFFENV